MEADADRGVEPCADQVGVLIGQPQIEARLDVPRDVPHRIVSTGDEPIELIATPAMTPVQVMLPDGTPLELA